MADNWKCICVAFNFDPVGRTLKKIEKQFPNVPNDCCIEMFQTWLKTKDASWNVWSQPWNPLEKVVLLTLLKPMQALLKVRLAHFLVSHLTRSFSQDNITLTYGCN